MKLLQTQFRWIILIAAVALAGIGWIAFTRVSAESAASSINTAPRIGFAAPAVRAPNPAGGEIDLARLRGKVVILNFWATWCGPCRAEMPALQRTADALANDGVVVLGINQQEDPETVNDFARELQVRFPLGLDQTAAIHRAYQVRGLPSTFFIDREGIIRDVVFGGPMDDALLRSKAEALARAR